MIIAKLVARRLAAAVVVLFVLSVITFALLALPEGGPERALLGNRPSTPEVLEAIRAKYLLDEPFLVQYWNWFTHAITGDFGTSITARQPVMTMIGQRFPITATLGIYALVLTVLIGIPAGLAAGLRRGKLVDKSITLVSLVFMSAPAFALALLLLYVFAVALNWFPVYGIGDLNHFTLPAIALALGQAAILVRQTRAAALDIGGQDYITFARARGLGRSRIWGRYSLRNSALPILTVAGLIAAGNLTGAVFVEQTFSLPGLGSLLVQAVGQKDIPLVQALVLLGGLVMILANLLVDVAYMIVDPRVRYATAA
ncbi:ABC transporter permease [Paenarthrobacter sp. NPDC056912]|uniref:ABC transporter permease n=1 Tax=Paenarthrobacter sp. NPDC056912 TaxID=3345965 RepID=UPI00366DFCC9